MGKPESQTFGMSVSEALCRLGWTGFLGYHFYPNWLPALWLMCLFEGGTAPGDEAGTWIRVLTLCQAQDKLASPVSRLDTVWKKQHLQW